MSKIQLKIWKKDSPEPKDYNQQSDPTQRTIVEDGQQSDYINRIAQALRDWIAEKSTESFETRLASIKASWSNSGGSLAIFEDMLQKAFLTSGFYKTMAKGA